MKITIFANQRDEFFNRLAHVNSRIKKYGVGAHVTAETVGKMKCSDGLTYATITMDIDSPELVGRDGVKYLGVSSFDGRSWITTVEEGVDASRLVRKDDICDHCHIRRRRTLYYYFEEDGEVKQIGSSCAEEYFGMDVNSVISSWNWFIASCDDFMDERKASNPFIDLGSIYNATKAVTRCWSEWYSGGRTSNDIIGCILEGEADEPRSKEFLEAELASIEKLLKDDHTSFADNIRAVIFDSDHDCFRFDYTRKYVGIVAYAIYLANKTSITTSEWIGEVGDTVTVVGECKFIGNACDNYGNTINHYDIIDENGNLVKLRTAHAIKSLNLAEEPLMARTRVRVTGKIGWCGSANGFKFTQLKGRLKIEEDI